MHANTLKTCLLPRRLRIHSIDNHCKGRKGIIIIINIKLMLLDHIQLLNHSFSHTHFTLPSCSELVFAASCSGTSAGYLVSLIYIITKRHIRQQVVSVLCEHGCQCAPLAGLLVQVEYHVQHCLYGAYWTYLKLVYTVESCLQPARPTTGPPALSYLNYHKGEKYVCLHDCSPPIMVMQWN